MHSAYEMAIFNLIKQFLIYDLEPVGEVHRQEADGVWEDTVNKPSGHFIRPVKISITHTFTWALCKAHVPKSEFAKGF